MTAGKEQSIQHLNETNLAQEAEVMFAIDDVLSKYSFNSCANKSALFSPMFPDSQITNQFSYGKTKCTYLITFGVAPYLKELLRRILKDLDHLAWHFVNQQQNREAESNGLACTLVG